MQIRYRVPKGSSRFSLEEMIELARKGVNADREEFNQLCQENALAILELAYWCDAYRSSGEAGVASLTTFCKVPREFMESAEKASIGFLRRNFPKQEFCIKRYRNRLTIMDIKPGYFRDYEEWPIFQLRYLIDGNTWHLFWRQSPTKWWPYVGGRHIRSLHDCLYSVLEDRWGCFFLFAGEI